MRPGLELAITPMSSPSNRPALAPHANRRQPTSHFAIASLICSCAVFCPILAPLAGIVLGSAALRRIRAARGALGGRRLALAGTFIGSLMLIVQLGLAAAGMQRVQRHIEDSMIRSVHDFVAAAIDDDPIQARQSWVAGGSSRPSVDEIAAFGAEVRQRYGRLMDFHLVNQVETGSMLAPGREVAAYFRFERGERSGWARFTIITAARTLVYETRLEKLVIEDPEQGDVVIPDEPVAARAP